MFFQRVDPESKDAREREYGENHILDRMGSADQGFTHRRHAADMTTKKFLGL